MEKKDVPRTITRNKYLSESFINDIKDRFEVVSMEVKDGSRVGKSHGGFITIDTAKKRLEEISLQYIRPERPNINHVQYFSTRLKPQLDGFVASVDNEVLQSGEAIYFEGGDLAGKSWDSLSIFIAKTQLVGPLDLSDGILDDETLVERGDIPTA
jgi:hypothetical protein